MVSILPDNPNTKTIMNMTQISKENVVSRADRSPQTSYQPRKETPMRGSAVQSVPSLRTGDATNSKAWVAKAAKQPMVLETVDLGPLGAEDVEVAVGQRVGVGWFSGSDMHCRQCMSGNHHLCPEAQATIIGHRGGFATHIRAHWAWTIPLPEKLNFADAGPLLCGGITVFSPLAMYAKPTDRVGIIGIGGLGHMAVKFAAAYGCEVTAFTSSESKFDEAKGFGANHVVSSKDSAAIKKLGGSFDLLISTVNVKLDWDAMIGTLAPNGRLHVVGAVLEPIPIAAFSLILQQRSVSGSPTGSPVAIETMLDFASRHNVVPQTEHFPMRKINEAFARLESGKARYRIVLDADF